MPSISLFVKSTLFKDVPVNTDLVKLLESNNSVSFFISWKTAKLKSEFSILTPENFEKAKFEYLPKQFLNTTLFKVESLKLH